MNTKWIVTTFMYGHGGTPVREFDNYNDAHDYYIAQQDETWRSVIMEKVEMVHRFICSEESSSKYKKIK